MVLPYVITSYYGQHSCNKVRKQKLGATVVILIDKLLVQAGGRLPCRSAVSWSCCRPANLQYCAPNHL